jgi:hypothetical protein
MDTPITAAPNRYFAIGQALNGGFFAGLIKSGEQLFALIVAPRAEGEHDDIGWGKRGKNIPGAASFFDGKANTEAMAAAGSKVGKWAVGLTIGSFNDWYLPSRDELELLYRNLKPTPKENYVWRHGDNPSSVPPGYPYTNTAPAQTPVAAFQEGGAEALIDTLYWSSTQYSPYGAWYQNFVGGGQYGYDKGFQGRARAVRRSLIQ